MYDNQKSNPLEGITSGINEDFSLVNTEITDYGWRWTFGKSEFKTGFLGGWPYLPEDAEEKWEARNEAWGRQLIDKFREFIPEEEVDNKLSELVEQINTNVSPEEQKTKEGILKGAKILYEGLIDLAAPYIKEARFNIVLFYKMTLDDEGNEKWYLNMPNLYGKTGNNWKDDFGNWKGGYPFAVGKKPPMNPNLEYQRGEDTESNPTTETTEATETSDTPNPKSQWD